MKGIFQLCLAILGAVAISEQVCAQAVVPDSTLGTVVTGNPNFMITGGTRPNNGSNLFHSFSQFSVPTGGTAFFDNALDVSMIFSRVTGGTVSNIDGMIQANGTASLFLLNPAGILFGNSAQLNIGGSFVGTTANSIRFADGTEFSAVNSSQTPLLTISAPVGLQFGSNPGSITHQSTTGFQVAPGKTLALIGGSLTIAGGTLSAPSGNIELGSVAANSQVGLEPTNFVMNYAGATGFQDIQLTQKAQVDASGSSGGAIQIQARQLSLKQGAQVRSNTLGSDQGKPITIRASERVEIVGTEDLSLYNIYYGSEDFDTSGLSGIYAVVRGGTGNGGSIQIDSPYLSVSQAGAIVANTRGQGNAGNLTIESQTVEINGNPDGNGFPSVLNTGTFTEGQGGNLTINADRLFSKDFVLVQSNSNGSGDAGNLTVNVRQFQAFGGSQFSSGAFASGNGSNLTVNATESVELIGFSTWDGGPFSTGLFSSVEPRGTGHGGNLRITTGRLSIQQGAKVTANLVGNGKAGNIVIRANEVEVSDPLVDFTGAISGIVTSVQNGSTGQGGNLDIVTDRLRVFRGGQITAATDGFGNAGSINLQAGDIDISGFSQDGQFRSSITASSTTSFNAGSINLRSDRLSVRDGANITVSNTGTGDAGNLNINAGTVFLNNGASLQAEVNGGSQGNIRLAARDLLLLRQDSQIVTSATGASTGGNITINAPIIVGLENSDIVANAVQGQGGNIQITTQGIIGLQYRDRTTPENDITASSEFGVNGTVEVNNVGVDPNSGLVELSTTLIDSTQQVAAGCSGTQGSSFVITGRGGVPQNPTQEVRRDRAWNDMRDLSTFQKTAIAPVPTQTATLVEATAWYRHPQTEKVELVAAHPTSSTPSATCASKLHSTESSL
ncbi:MAG: S-layer family protein [Leptolyngbya sp. UWPOB_LEPTO1]|uniref:S-layer family protein n=1 Tax=Leptolyngbya sp. UWPOB_LEPTO1 TaxID=2815653 RepID=UPI001AC96473|nr:S-layer family protein [Leptolyngbya sp. UWPOB_LEPTO1]MBN8561260.1 S-layer family protein [Leptolyngbya sp. UWPOB_LEPTO1]